jgi:hypothetical protein
MPLAVGSPRQRKIGNIPNASVAQLVEQKTLNLLVLGSNPSRGTSFEVNDRSGPQMILCDD